MRKCQARIYFLTCPIPVKRYFIYGMHLYSIRYIFVQTSASYVRIHTMCGFRTLKSSKPGAGKAGRLVVPLRHSILVSYSSSLTCPHNTHQVLAKCPRALPLEISHFLAGSPSNIMCEWPGRLMKVGCGLSKMNWAGRNGGVGRTAGGSHLGGCDRRGHHAGRRL